MNNEQVPKKEKWPTKSSLRLFALGNFFIGAIGSAYWIRIYIYDPVLRPSGHLLVSQENVDNLLKIVRILDLIIIPMISTWMLYISILLWLYLRKPKPE
jgi:hypothetical protein